MSAFVISFGKYNIIFVLLAATEVAKKCLSPARETAEQTGQSTSRLSFSRAAHSTLPRGKCGEYQGVLPPFACMQGGAEHFGEMVDCTNMPATGVCTLDATTVLRAPCIVMNLLSMLPGTASHREKTGKHTTNKIYVNN